LLSGLNTSRVQIRHINSLCMILVLLIVSLGTYIILLFKILHYNLGIVSIVEKLNLTTTISLLYPFFSGLIAILSSVIVSCMSATIVSHYTRFLRYITSIMLLLLSIRILLVIILLLLLFYNRNLLFSLLRKVGIILLIQINISIANLTW